MFFFKAISLKTDARLGTDMLPAVYTMAAPTTSLGKLLSALHQQRPQAHIDTDNHTHNCNVGVDDDDDDDDDAAAANEHEDDHINTVRCAKKQSKSLISGK